VSCDLVEVQAKLRKGMPTYLREWLDGIVGTAIRVGKIGIVVWKEPRALDANAAVVMRLSDFVTLLEKARGRTDG
jgi:hypothetical protein